MKELEKIWVLFFRPLTLATQPVTSIYVTGHDTEHHYMFLLYKDGEPWAWWELCLSWAAFPKPLSLGEGFWKWRGQRVGVELVWLSRQQPSLAQGRSHPASRVSSHESLAQVCCEVLEAHCCSSAQWASLCVPPPSCCLHRCMRFCPYSFKHFVYPLCLT